MQDKFGSVRRSLVFRSSGGEDGGIGVLVEKIGSSIRNSTLGLFFKPPAPARPIRWRKGELIGCGAFGRVYMGMNLDSGELLAIKQVLITTNSNSNEKTQAHIRELEEEVKLLKNLSHPNIVRYLGTVREEESLNILLEFVPGGSISSLLGKFGSFPEAVIRMYTKQLLLGLEYLHKNGIMHRDIKGANILVDNKGRIKLADFGASKKVIELATTVSGAKSMKGTPYWMAPEVILQTGHSFSADIWSVGCTVIEMATGKPPWSQQYQEVAALFHIGHTKSHPPIPEHLSVEAKDFLLKCLQKEPNLRPGASELLQHPFVSGTGTCGGPNPIQASFVENSVNLAATPGKDHNHFISPVIRTTSSGLKGVCDIDSVRRSTIYTDKFSGRGSLWGANNCDDDLCQLDYKDDLSVSQNFNPVLLSADLNKSFNPMCEPTDDWPCKFDESPEVRKSEANLLSHQTQNEDAITTGKSCKADGDFSFQYGPSETEDDDEVTESKIRAFLDEKAIDLKKLQTPLYEEFYNTMNAAVPSSTVGAGNSENVSNILNLPPKTKSPNRLPSRRLSAAVEAANCPSPVTKHASNVGGATTNQTMREIQTPQLSEWKGLLAASKEEHISPSLSFSERQRKWKEELDEELERKREMMRQAGIGGKTSSPKDLNHNRQRERSRFASPGR